MGKKLFVPVIAVLIAIAAVSAYSSFPMEKTLVVEGTAIDSKGLDPFEVFPSFAENTTFIVSPQMNEKATNLDHTIFNSTALFLQVLNGNNRNAIQILRAHNQEKELLYCYTNYGDLTKSERLEKEECLELLSQEGAGIIMIEFPDEQLPGPVIEISSQKLVVRPNKESTIGSTSFLALRILFKNAEQVIEGSSTILDSLNI